MQFCKPAKLKPECFAYPAPADSTQGPEGDKIEALFGQLMELLTMSLFLDLWQNYPIFLRCVTLTIEQVIQLIQLGQVPDVKSGQDCSFNIWYTPTLPVEVIRQRNYVSRPSVQYQGIKRDWAKLEELWDAIKPCRCGNS